MKRRVASFAFVAFLAASAGVLAQQTSHHRNLKFGDEVVTLKFSNIPPSRELDKLCDATNEATDPVERERLLRIRWEDYGETIAFQNLVMYHLDRGDLVSAYAHFYAVVQISKWYVSTLPKGKPQGPVHKQFQAIYAGDLAEVSAILTTAQRKAGVKLAAALIRNNPNCCTPI